MPLSTAFVICEAFGWESGVDKRFRDAPAFFSIYTLVLAVGALVVLLPGPRPAPADRRLAEPPGPAAAGRAGVHGPAGQRRAADGRAPQRPDRRTSSPGRRSGSSSLLDVVLLGVAACSAPSVSGRLRGLRVPARLSGACRVAGAGTGRATRRSGPARVLERVARRASQAGTPSGTDETSLEAGRAQQRRRDARAIAAGADRGDRAVARQLRPAGRAGRRRRCGARPGRGRPRTRPAAGRR